MGGFDEESVEKSVHCELGRPDQAYHRVHTEQAKALHYKICVPVNNSYYLEREKSKKAWGISLTGCTFNQEDW